MHICNEVRNETNRSVVYLISNFSSYWPHPGHKSFWIINISYVLLSSFAHRLVKFLGHETGEITVGAATVLDREMTPEITITVMASDGAHVNARRSTTVPVVVKLIDVNDNRPIFSQHSYRASVAENLSVNPPAPILQVLSFKTTFRWVRFRNSVIIHSLANRYRIFSIVITFSDTENKILENYANYIYSNAIIYCKIHKSHKMCS